MSSLYVSTKQLYGCQFSLNPTCKQAGIDINPAGKAPFSVAIGPDPFTTDGTAVQHAPMETLSTDGEDMTFNVGGAHVADIGGSAGSGQAKNLLNVVKTCQNLSTAVNVL